MAGEDKSDSKEACGSGTGARKPRRRRASAKSREQGTANTENGEGIEASITAWAAMRNIAMALRVVASRALAPVWRPIRVWAPRLILGFVAATAFMVALYAVVNPPGTPTIWGERLRLGQVEREWTRIEDMSPHAARSVVAAEDANFCLHWGFDAEAIRDAIEGGGRRGASSITQQVVKNVYLWQGRSWFRKALETAITPLVELVWSKRRILEVYLNVAEMGEGVFGIEAAARRHFSATAATLGPVQAARIAASLPAPKTRNPASPSPWLRRRAESIRDGAETIAVDGRSACFEDDKSADG